LAGTKYQHPFYERQSEIVIGGDYITTESGIYTHILYVIIVFTSTYLYLYGIYRYIYVNSLHHLYNNNLDFTNKKNKHNR
jgi:hypothetical protein